MSGGLMSGGLMSDGRMSGGRLSGGLKSYDRHHHVVSNDLILCKPRGRSDTGVSWFEVVL